MSKTSMVALLAPALLAVAAFTAATDRATQPSACEIRMTATPLGVKIDGVVHGRTGRSGSYQLELQKSGPSGHSDVSQGGDFTVGANGEAVVSESELNVSRGDVYRVAMTVSSGARCERSLPAR
jgi:PPE-repeat protein